MAIVAIERWKVVKGSEADDWGICRESETHGKSIAQMLWEEDARHIVDLHNVAVSQEVHCTTCGMTIIVKAVPKNHPAKT
jgi:DNA-directed RNA polymerase subunit RPC12/RpoP